MSAVRIISLSRGDDYNNLGGISITLMLPGIECKTISMNTFSPNECMEYQTEKFINDYKIQNTNSFCILCSKKK